MRADDSGGPEPGRRTQSCRRPRARFPGSIGCAGDIRTVTASAHRPCGPSFQSRLPAHERLRVSVAGGLDGPPDSRGESRDHSGRACTDSRPAEIERRRLDRDGAELRPLVQAGRGRPYLDEEICPADRSLLVPRPARSRGRISLLTPGRLARAPAPGLPVFAMAHRNRLTAWSVSEPARKLQDQAARRACCLLSRASIDRVIAPRPRRLSNPTAHGSLAKPDTAVASDRLRTERKVSRGSVVRLAARPRPPRLGSFPHWPARKGGCLHSSQKARRWVSSFVAEGQKVGVFVFPKAKGGCLRFSKGQKGVRVPASGFRQTPEDGCLRFRSSPQKMGVCVSVRLPRRWVSAFPFPLPGRWVSCVPRRKVGVCVLRPWQWRRHPVCVCCFRCSAEQST